MPKEVRDAQEAAKACKNRDEPPPPVSAEVLDALRGFFEDKEDKEDRYGPLVAWSGGYIDMCEGLGVVPSSTDPLVKDPDKNCFNWSFRGDDPDEVAATNERMYQQHHARVRLRLLRYQEWVEAQTARGLAPHAEWRRKNKHAFKTAEECVADRAYGGDSSDSDEDDPEDEYRDPQPPFSPDKSEGMTKSQLEPYCNAFTAGFYGFTNHDRIHSGTGSGGGVKKVGDAAAADIRRRGIRGAGGKVPPEDMTFLSM